MLKLFWLLTFSTVLVWSAIDPKDGIIWLLEAGPAIIGFVIIAATYRSFPLTTLT